MRGGHIPRFSSVNTCEDALEAADLNRSARNALVSGLAMELDKHACYTVDESSNLTIALDESVIRQRYEELIHEVGAEIRGSEA